MNALALKDVTKQFGEFLSVKNLSFQVSKGTIFGLRRIRQYRDAIFSDPYPGSIFNRAGSDTEPERHDCFGAFGDSLFTPGIMVLRMAVYSPPLWQILLSMFQMVASIAATIWVAAKIYRTGILIYGKKPDLREIVRWLRYA